MTKHRKRVGTVFDLLEKLQNIKINTIDGNEKITKRVFDAKKGHLVHLIPIFIECIETREVEVREKVKDILFEISGIMLQRVSNSQ